MIYLFCNEAYGRPFRERAVRWARRRRAGLTVVRSGRRRRRGLRRTLEAVGFRLATGIPLRVVDDVNDAPFADEAHGIVAGFNQIFSAATIARFRSLVNFHPSLLPLYRGPVPSYWCIRNGETTTGYTLHRISERIDDGEILYQETVRIAAHRDAGRTDREIAERAAVQLECYLDRLWAGEAWTEVRRLDAHAVYREHVGYRSFPRVEGARE
ncbi:MAG: formyltransferase family protein [Planctomycetota bacterium]